MCGMCVRLCYICKWEYVWRSEIIFRIWFSPSTHHVDSGHQTQVIRHGSKHLYLANHLDSLGLELLAFLTNFYLLVLQACTTRPSSTNSIFCSGLFLPSSFLTLGNIAGGSSPDVCMLIWAFPASRTVENVFVLIPALSLSHAHTTHTM